MLEEKLVIELKNGSKEAQERLIELFSSLDEVEVSSFESNDTSIFLIYPFTYSTEPLADSIALFLHDFTEVEIYFENVDEPELTVSADDCYNDIENKISFFRRRFLYNTIMAQYAKDLKGLRKMAYDSLHKNKDLTITLELVQKFSLELPRKHLQELVDYIDEYLSN